MIAGGSAVLLASAWPLSEILGDAADARRPWRQGPFGPVRRDPAGILDLPEGFTYRIVDRSGDRMDDGYVVPGRPDAMAVFPLADGSLALMRNHENPAGIAMLGAFEGREPPAEAWDSSGMGGVTRVVLDPTTLERRSSNLVLAGTTLNCAGGPSPWGWLSCEETFTDRHGYVFIADPTADRVALPQRVPAFGRFRHEAACVEPSTLVTYLSEDREDGCLYRFVPRSFDTPFEGELSALAIRGRRGADTAAGLDAGDRLEIAWVPVGAPDSGADDLRHRAAAAGAATFKRGEGLWRSEDARGHGVLHLSCTTGGPAAAGQIFRVEPEADGGELVLLAQSRSQDDFDMPDNLTVSPGGQLFFCEDGHGRNYVRGLDHDGGVFDFARNARSRSEITGVCFSPDGAAMFLALQGDGLTLSVQGPFAPRA